MSQNKEPLVQNQACQPTILIVDDNPTNLSVMSDYLKTYGYRILVARDGESGIEKACYAKPDLILLDVMMPGIDGFETCRRLKNNPEVKDIAVVFMTALAETDNKIKAFKAGAVDYVTKPMQPAEVLARVSTHLQIRNLTLSLQTQAAQLRHANLALEEHSRRIQAANQAKSEFLANMSHEIRTPINSIITMGYLIMGGPLPPETRKQIEIIRLSAATLMNLINDILDFSKIEAGQLDLEQADFDLEHTLQTVGHILGVKAGEKRLKLTCQIEPGVPIQLVGDSGRLAQILTNLGANAIKFTETGHVTIACALEQQSKEDVLLHFAVSDTGIGIAADRMNLIFDAFKQADSSTTRKYGGTGLGLSICQRLSALMGGRIWVESRLGKGSTFHFTARFRLQDSLNAPSVIVHNNEPFALSDQKKTMVPRGRNQKDHHDCQAVNLSQLNILLAEDNAINQKIMVKILEKVGCRITAVADGQEALAQHARQVFDLVLMDVQMPNVDGFEATRMIRKREKETKQHLPIIAMTALAMKGDKEKCQTAGMDDYIAKPVNPESLFQLMGKWRDAVHNVPETENRPPA